MTVQKTKDTLSLSLDKMQQNIKNLAQDAHKFWVGVTPIRTGNARRRTRLNGDTITADYPYAVPLDDGRSKQAPKGMSQPTEKYIQQRMRAIMRKK